VSDSSRERVRVFVSAKSGDYEYAAQVYRRLGDAGVAAFFSQESLPALGNADYRREIDRALDEADHMIVVTSSIDHVLASWVEAEWGFFINEKRVRPQTGQSRDRRRGRAEPHRPASKPSLLRGRPLRSCRLIVWDLATARPSIRLQGAASESFVGAAILGDATVVAALADGRLRLWEER
jgi:hypothetical protein